MSVSYPGESAAYRAARNTLLQAELELRAQIEKVAEMRRALPAGGAVARDYEFTATDGSRATLSGLFTTDRQVLAVYSLMYAPDAKTPCPMCVSLIDGLAGQTRHLEQAMDLVIVSAAGPERLDALARSRGWSELTLLSARGSSYQADYNAEMADGSQLPMLNIFRKTPDAVRHFWGSEAFFADVDGQPRHLDQIWPLWNMLDLTPQGRGQDWNPGLNY